MKEAVEYNYFAYERIGSKEENNDICSISVYVYFFI